jgi:hypothetical protein
MRGELEPTSGTYELRRRSHAAGTARRGRHARGWAFSIRPGQAAQSAVVKKKDESAAGREAYDAIVARYEATGAAVGGRMMGMPALKAAGKLFAGYTDGTMTFKLGEPARAGALEIPGARLFDPSGMGRPMREWVQVPAAAADRWPDLAEAALAYLRGE